MKTIMAKNLQDLKFHWTTKVSNEDQQLPLPLNLISKSQIEEDDGEEKKKENEKQNVQEHITYSASASASADVRRNQRHQHVAVSRFHSVVLAALGRHRANSQLGLGHKVTGTLFGHRKGHVHFAFQKEPGLEPAFLIELANPITGLVREMSTGLVRIALECNKEEKKQSQPSRKLVQETAWRTLCNGKKCGFATRRDCGAKEWSILKALEPISTGAGVLPGKSGGEKGGATEAEGGEIMYMRAMFERVVGSRDSEAFYMINPDSNGAPELSIYLLRL